MMQKDNTSRLLPWFQGALLLGAVFFLAVAFVSLRLFIHVVRPALHQPDWFTLVVVTALFSWGLSRRQLLSAPGADHAG